MLRRTLSAALVLLLTLPLTTMAQTKKSFTLDDLMWGGSNYWNIMPTSLFTTFWGERLVETGVEDVSVIGDAKGRIVKKKKLFTVDDVNAVIDTATLGKVRTLTYASFPDGKKTHARLNSDKATIIYDWQKKTVVSTTKKPKGDGIQTVDVNDASQNVAYVRNYNLYVTTADGQDHPVSTDGTRELQYGLSVHRDEFGISKGTFWSPSGKSLAFYRMDQTLVTDYPLVDIANRVAQPAPEKYPMAGMTSHKVTVGIYNTATDKTIYLQAGDPTDRYFTNIAWSPDEKTIYLFELPRTQDKAELVAYDAATGQRRGVLYTEEDSRYVEPMNPIVFLPWDSSKFIMQSRRDGYNNIYLFSADGRLLKQLTKDLGEVIEVAGFNKLRKSVVFKANPGNPTFHKYFSVGVVNGEIAELTPADGVHRARLSEDGTVLLDNWSSPGMYRRYDLVGDDGRERNTIRQVDDPWAEYNVPEITGGTIKAADNTTNLYYRLVKPVGFDPAKKYPAVVYVYGGPHAHNVDASWHHAARPWEIYMAQRGYVVFVVDNRGSQYRGRAFEQVTHRHLGDVEMQDQMEGVKFLKSLPYVDGDRLGVHGWSFGGFMTTNLMLTYPETFKVGVAGGPVIDWKYYEVMYGERYMDTPEENPEGYASSSLLNKAGNLKGRLQIIVGYNDPTCVLQHSLSFLRACEDAGTQPDYFVYPGDGHNMMGRDMVHLHERITRYFDDFLK